MKSIQEFSATTGFDNLNSFLSNPELITGIVVALLVVVIP